MAKFTSLKSDMFLGAFLLVLALGALFVWIPLDIDTGLVERVRRRNVIGDTLAPTAAIILIILASGGLILSRSHSRPVASFANGLGIFGYFISVFTVTLMVMRYLGPLFISLVNETSAAELNYRNLRNIWPLKYLGYVVGGTFLLSVLSHFMDNGLSRRRIALFFLITFMIALFFDLPFEDILLPPNGDV